MSKQITYDLNCRVKGKKLIKKLEIDFIPNKRHDDYAKLQSEIFEVQAKWNNIKLLQSEILLLINEKKDDNDEAIEKFKKEIEKLSEDIKIINASKVIERRFNLVKDILIDNGFSDEIDLMSWDFWNNSVEPSSVNEFLELAIYKDIDKKKVLH